jgi:hypothetical protein
MEAPQHCCSGSQLYKIQYALAAFLSDAASIKDIQISEDEFMFDARPGRATLLPISTTRFQVGRLEDFYVRSRDAYGYTTLTSDSIYLGSSAPQNENHAAGWRIALRVVTLYQLDSGGARICPNSRWLGGRSVHGSQQRRADANQRQRGSGRPGSPPSRQQRLCLGLTSTFYMQSPMVAYFRLKVGGKNRGRHAGYLDVTAGANTQSRTLTGANFRPQQTTLHRNRRPVHLHAHRCQSLLDFLPSAAAARLP